MTRETLSTLLAVALLLLCAGCRRGPGSDGSAQEREAGANSTVAAGDPSVGDRRVALRELPDSRFPVGGAGDPNVGTATAASVGGDGIPAQLLAGDQAYEGWFKRHGLDLKDPRMLDADPDGDGFTNREEFLADTDPRDANSRPGIHKTLRLKEYKEVRVPLLLESVNGNTARIRLLEAEAQRSVTVEAGQTVHGMRVLKVLETHESDKSGQMMDRSRVELMDSEAKVRVILVKDMPSRSAASHAVLVAPDGVEILVRQGEDFADPTRAGTSYRVIDLRAEQAVVRELSSGETLTIPLR